MFKKRQFQFACFLAVVLPLLGVLVLMILAFADKSFGHAEAITCFVMFVITLIGIEIGYHRLFSHKAFQTFWPLRLMFGIFGCMAVQGSVLWWSGVHRTHHQHTDTPDDPHSPLDGFLHAHFLWLFSDSVNPENWTRRIKDLYGDPVVAILHRYYLVFAVLGFLIPAAILGLHSGSWTGVINGALWGGLVRMFLVNHVIWSINSICHAFGSRRYKTRDTSRNNYWLMVLSLGFSLHNNHHASPKSATNQHMWWEIDLCGLLIQSLALAKLVWNVSTPSEQLLSRRSIRSESSHWEKESQ